MPKRKYAFKKGEPLRLEISYTGWRGFIGLLGLVWKRGEVWKDISVRLDGKEIGTIANEKILKKGREFYLEDGSVLKVQLIKNSVSFFSEELQVTLNGKLLHASELNSLIGAYISIFFIGISRILGVILLYLVRVGFSGATVFGVKSIIFTIIHIIYGAFFLLLGFLVKRQSIIALTIAVILYGLEIIYWIALVLQQKESFDYYGIITSIFLWFIMVRGFKAIHALK